MIMEDPLISVIVPVYKVEEYLQKCVDSLLMQTYQNLEIILVDDESPDNCPQLCDSIAENSPNIMALHKKNGGLGSARNFGVDHANGEWIVFVDSDDYVSPNYIEDMWELQQKYNADIVSCGITKVDEQGNILAQAVFFEPICLSGETAFTETYFYGKAGWRSYAKLLKCDIVKKHPFPEGYFEDFATTYKYFIDCEKVVISSYCENYKYVQRSDSILNSRLNEKHMHAFEICDSISKYIEEYYPVYANHIYLLYLRQVIQILNKQSMTKTEYLMIFKKYQKLFRKNFFNALNDKKLTFKTKIYLGLLCTSPQIYSLARNIA